MKVVILLTSFGMIGYSAYNFIWRIERDLNKAYLAKGYEINQLAISGRNYQIIKPENVLLTEYFKSIIALAPENSVVFIQKNNNVYNVSYLARGKSSSFTFAEVDKDTVKCKIREILYEGVGICGI
ncbi:hypothetical protein [Aeromonas schubertii]|uniref:hypothetical protein n=1 Tax=Aeromonas schubertii TaxID=652 RepID=UPI0010A77496|nr:hypothetical protein [Aeromonas schubertii]QCG47282.1 hypothetical protein E2P79_04930 [Aeromonas schubertii]